MTRDRLGQGAPDERGDLDPGPGLEARQGATQAPRTATYRVHFRTGARGQRRLREGAPPSPPPTREGVPRIAKLMALAIHFDKLIREGVVADYADIARLGGVSRARVSQVMDLLTLAPDIQERILGLPHSCVERNECSERRLRGTLRECDWEQQRRLCSRLIGMEVDR